MLNPINLFRRWRHRRNRSTFSYFSGYRLQQIDPMVACRDLNNFPNFDWASTPVKIDRGDDEALRLTVAAVRSAFKLDESGLTETDCIQLLIKFRMYLVLQKKSGNLLQTLPRSTARQSSEKSTTSAESVSGSTPSESSSDPASPQQ